MNPKWLALVPEFLEKASQEFSNHGCNDWNFPDDWTTEEKQEFVRSMHEDNGDIEEYDRDNLDVPDWWVMTFLGKRMAREIGEK